MIEFEVPGTDETWNVTVCWRADKQPAAWAEHVSGSRWRAEHLPPGRYDVLARPADGGNPRGMPVNVPDRLWAVSDKDWQIMLALADIRARLDGQSQSEPPENFLQYRKDGESMDQFRQRMRMERASMHSKMMGAREGVGSFTEDDRKWLAYLDSVDWLRG